jgi:DNA-directed RNA polymerase sigma subunit (sigma70/sigma32)
VLTARHELVARLGREPHHRDIAAELGLSPFEVIELLSYNEVPLSLDDTAGPEGTGGLADLLPHPSGAGLPASPAR